MYHHTTKITHAQETTGSRVENCSPHSRAPRDLTTHMIFYPAAKLEVGCALESMCMSDSSSSISKDPSGGGTVAEPSPSAVRGATVSQRLLDTTSRVIVSARPNQEEAYRRGLSPANLSKHRENRAHIEIVGAIPSARGRTWRLQRMIFSC